MFASLLVVLAVPVTAYAGPADDAKQLLTEAAAAREEMVALSAQIDELESQIGEIDPTAKNAADALPLLAEARADYAEQSEKAASVAALMDEVAALDVSEEMTTYAGLRKQFAESWTEFCALEIDGIGKLEILFDPGRMSKLSQADHEKLVATTASGVDEDEVQPGYRGKTFVRDGLEIWRGELTEEFADAGWWTEKDVFVFHVLEGEASVRFKDGRVISVRQGDSGIIPPGEPGAHTVDVPAGRHCVIVGFAQA